MSTKDIDRGYDQAYKNMLDMAKKPYVKIGIINNKKYEQTDNKKTSPLTIVEVATYNEFGTRTIPERLFLRSTADENKNKWPKKFEPLQNQMITGKIKVKKALSLAGMAIEADIRKMIQRTNPKWKPLAFKTIKRKKSSRPLIDTGQLINSIASKVIMNK